MCLRLLNPTKKTTQWLVNTCVRINFNLVWSAITIQEVRDKFCQNYVTSL